ncbi:hypothetical protein ACHAWF_019028 [Thalassiosira exigua]
MNEPRTDNLDDFEHFIRHSDFGKILELASTLKGQKSQLVIIARGQREGPRGAFARTLPTRSAKKVKTEPEEHQEGTPDDDDPSIRLEEPPEPEEQQHFSPDGGLHGGGNGERPLSRRGRQPTDSFDSAAELIRTTLISPPEEGANPGTDVMGRGECLITDSLIDETIKSLADELKLCLDLKKQLRAMPRRGSRYPERRPMEDRGANLGVSKQISWNSKAEDGGRNGSRDVGEEPKPLVSKFAKWQTDILIQWMIDHREHPFPTNDDIRNLARATLLTDTQVVNWTTNVRKRNLRATIEREKKPHHFLDYLFLATDREKKMLNAHPNAMDFSYFDTEGTGNSFQGSFPPAFKPGLGHPTAVDSHSNKYYQHSDIHFRNATALPVPPKAPRNTDQIFRRGKRLSNLMKSREVKEERVVKEREGERLVLQEYAPHGIADLPPGCFDESERKHCAGDFNEHVFDDGEAMAESEGHCGDLNERKAVSFSCNSMAEAPFDENAEDYLMKLMWS